MMFASFAIFLDVAIVQSQVNVMPLGEFSASVCIRQEQCAKDRMNSWCSVHLVLSDTHNPQILLINWMLLLPPNAALCESLTFAILPPKRMVGEYSDVDHRVAD